MWYLLHSPASDGARNMALDEALMQFASESNTWICRVYTWRSPTLSLGRNQRARGAYDLQRIADCGIDVVRRPTGGRAILHHHEVTYSVVGPVRDAGDLRESYARINRLLIAALGSLGVSATVVEQRSKDPVMEQPGLLPCFHHPSVGEITFGGRKLVGSAQWRADDVLLQHGSILVDDDQMRLSSLLIGPGAEIPAAATLRDALGHAPSESQVAVALFEAVRAIEDPNARLFEPDARLLARANALHEHYLDQSWTWRR
jgi:lipoyl(octanoyl) transferase